ncbi:MAG TPA: hypothetical protein VFM32_02185 [Spongiibacteraceae bacterium]|nr:hypothetical protein [Spongiibacteraceae bacterium]
MRWLQWCGSHPLRLHMGLVLLLKLVALVAIYHYFFSSATRVPIDNARVAAQLLQPAVPPRDVP